MKIEFTIGRWYHDGKRAYELLAIEDDRLLVRYQGEAEPVRRLISIQSGVAEPLDGPPQPAPQSPKPKAARRKTTKPRTTDDDKTFLTKETSPVIADLIHKRGRETGDFVLHDEIVRLILADPKGKYLVEQAIRRGNTDPPGRIAGNMLDFLSKAITEGTSEYTDSFELKKIGGKWAYKKVR